MSQSNVKDNPNIEPEKLAWMREMEMKEFEYPAKYHVRGWCMSEEFIKNTPLETLKERYEDFRYTTPWVND